MTTAAYTLVPSPREQDVLELLAAGYRVPRIAELMCLSERTVEHHVERAKCKFGAETREMLMVLAMRAGYLSEEGSYSCVS